MSVYLWPPPIERICPRCDGTGYLMEEVIETCNVCSGIGVNCRNEKCLRCKGAGIVSHRRRGQCRCPTCNGSGKIKL